MIEARLIRDGLSDRVWELMRVIERMPASLSDEEVEGLVRLLPPDSARSISAMLVPRIREVSLVFLKMFATWMRRAREAPGQGKKTILIPFNFPPELLHAFESTQPVTSEILSTLGVVALEGQGERYWDMAMALGFPDHMCSSNTIALGSMLGSTDFRPQALISAAPGGCDANAKIHEFVAYYHDIPMFILQKPTDDSPRGRAQYALYMRRLVEQLERFLGEKLDEDRLRSVLTKANRCTELAQELWDLHKVRPCPVPNLFSLYIYGVRFTMWGTDEGIEVLTAMVDLAKRRLAAGAYPAEREVARCLWAYTSYYYDFTSFFNWTEEQGYTHLGDGLGLFFPEPVDTSSMDSMIGSLAHTAGNMPMTRQVGAQSMSGSWSNDVIYAAKDLDADCVVYCGHHSCKQTWSVVSILREELSKRLGLPLLILQGDSWMKTMTPMSVIKGQLREFVENVVATKKRPRRKVRRAAANAAG